MQCGFLGARTLSAQARYARVSRPRMGPTVRSPRVAAPLGTSGDPAGPRVDEVGDLRPAVVSVTSVLFVLDLESRWCNVLCTTSWLVLRPRTGLTPMTKQRLSMLAWLTVWIAVATSDAAEPDLPELSGYKRVPITTADVPPEWAVLERHLLDQLYPAAQAFVQKYTRADGTIIWRDAWPGMDGSDDGYESFYNFPLYYALGGHEDIAPLAEKLWNGVTRQFTEYGQVHNEFDAHYDWMHHGESYTYFYFFGLTNPTLNEHRERALRFAGLYMDEDRNAQNYDSTLKIIRSPINGSRGPHFNNTAEDWVTHRPILANYPLPFEDIPHIRSSADWNDDGRFPHILDAINRRMMRGDVPLNLTATSLMANALMYTGDAKYRTWVQEYVGGWIERVRRNDGILPDNVGLSGKIGENMDGNWWGGYYGWQWPHGLFNQLESTTIGATNAYLVSGDASALELPRSVIDLVSKHAKQVDGTVLVPHRHGKSGWYDYRPIASKYLAQLWYISRSPEDWERLVRLVDTKQWRDLSYQKGKGDSEHAGPWLMYVRGENDDYPLEILQSTYRETLDRLARIRADDTGPAEQDVHHWQKLNPVILEGLVQLTLGAPNHIYHGGLLHASLRYFDPERRRPGLPPEVAALVERLTPNGIRLRLVNLHPTEKRTVVLQAGMFAEHEFTRVRQVMHYPYQFDEIDGRRFVVELVPGAVGRLEIDMRRFVNQPTYAFPW
jgi:hypothetical protein